MRFKSISMHSLSFWTFLFQMALVIGLLFLIDLYAFQGIKTALNGISVARFIKPAFWVFHIAFYIYFFIFFFGFFKGTKASPGFINLSFTTFIIFYLPKLIFLVFLLGEDFYRGARFAFDKMSSLFQNSSAEPTPGVTLISRGEFLNRAGILVATIPFLGLLYGYVKGKYDYTVRKVKILIPDLPEALQGFTITQISDLHIGSFDDKDAVENGIELANAQNSDLMVMTGDLVNNRTEEANEYENVFSKLKAPMGVFSILGNHDYGDYTRNWKDGEKEQNFQDMLAIHKRMGWKLMMDENVILEKNGEKIALIGVQNISAKANFHSYGNLSKAFSGSENIGTKILLSHDPTHWDAEVIKSFKDIHLTLSGHTHGAQMGIEIPGFKFSPSQWIFKHWAGLYTEGNQHLYVNRGFGFIGYAGRIGIKPEITVLELGKA